MIEQLLLSRTTAVVRQLYGADIAPQLIAIQKTRREFEGDYTLVVFPLLKLSKKSPEATAQEIGDAMTAQMEEVTAYNVIKGFLNLTVADSYWKDFYKTEKQNALFGQYAVKEAPPVVIEFSSPNTNKPLHLGHVRNNLLGHSLANILHAAGKKVVRVNLVNDRGIHICKSMLAWKKWGNGETPESSGLKGDQLVGKYYVLFDRFYKAEIKELIKNGMDEELAEKEASLLMEAQEMLRQWEEQNPEIRKMWKEMNGWVYEGFDATYERLGISFDKTYYESDTYLLGRELVFEGIEKKVFYKKQDGSVWCDLTSEGLDEKLLLRADGTSVYITQDLGTAQLRHDEYDPQQLIYVVGNEQNYHFDVLKKTLKKLGRQWSDDMLHLSYGMVELPQGRMKSREGTVVDADDLMQEMADTARKTTLELGKTDEFDEQGQQALFEILGQGALKYFILKIDPKKSILFNPEESIDFNGNTGPFIQYTYARTRSLLRKAAEKNIAPDADVIPAEFHPKERTILKIAYDFPVVVAEAAKNLSPAVIANYAYELAKEFNNFYQQVPILRDAEQQQIVFRLGLSEFVGNILKNAMQLLGIDVPERM
ncbi:MAG: arginine--tRNA ligase [Bacteroidales bacterium]|jgi:arginyl-tRNA synthetase|nr:arginine--tRNA ligase [Bacteroidales bacterium]NCU36270.1 arginine--tRNA ligase [Candidatus Falkowbacteria bacterium]MDD2633148.1 arginine--tRNA ligase [Bacteroidales bacterium]MDD3132017.1 arginine--tRNA ligase [Bacteroidales bacterium]MDD4176938.1 arginine--tRNA ligase [Bacteroidales bacterium]